MSPEEQAGRRILLVYIALVMTISVFVITIFVLGMGIESLPTRVIWFFLTPFVCYWMYGGSRAAKAIVVIFSMLVGQRHLAARY